MRRRVFATDEDDFHRYRNEESRIIKGLEDSEWDEEDDLRGLPVGLVHTSVPGIDHLMVPAVRVESLVQEGPEVGDRLESETDLPKRAVVLPKREAGLVKRETGLVSK